MTKERFVSVFGVRLAVGPGVLGRGVTYVVATGVECGEGRLLAIGLGSGYLSAFRATLLLLLVRHAPRVMGFVGRRGFMRDVVSYYHIEPTHGLLGPGA